MVKNPLANSGDLRDMGSNPGSGRFPGGGQPTPVFLLGESQGQKSLAVYCLWGLKESDMTEPLRLLQEKTIAYYLNI